MSLRKILPLFAIALAARSQALTEEGRKTGDELVTTLQLELKEIAVGDDDNRAFALKQYLRQVQAALAQENNRQLEQVLENFGNYDPSPKVTGFIAVLKKDMKEDVKQKTQAVITEMQGIIAAAREAIIRAEEPDELDKVLLSLSRNRFINQGDNQSYDSNDATVRSLLSELSNAKQFVNYWQDYLQASNSGDVGQATQSLRNLSGQETSLIPRSQIIARLDFEKNNVDALTKIRGEVRTLEDMKPAIQKLAKLQSTNRSSGYETGEARETLMALAALEKTYREFQAGLPVDVSVLYQSADGSDAVTRLNFIPLRAELLMLVLPRSLNLPETFKAVPGESVDQFLRRAGDDAASRADIPASRRIREARQLLARANNINSKDQEALADYAAAQNQLAARQYMLAVVSFQKALKSGSDLIPAEKTGEILESIKKDHSEDYQAGMTEFLTPRPVPEPDYPGMPYRGYIDRSYMDRGWSRQGNRDATPPGTNIILPVPAREEKPEPKAAEKAKPPEKAPDR